MDSISDFYPPSSVTVDFLLGIPNQNLEDLHKIRSFLENYTPGHVSAYILTVEKNTLLYNQVNQSKSIKMPNESKIVDLYNEFQEIMTNLHYSQYEISSYCKDQIGKIYY